MRALNFADRVRPMALNMGSVPTLASDLGFMSKEGLNVKIVECDGSPQTLALFEGKGDRFKILASGKDFSKAEAVAFLVVVSKEKLVLEEPQTALSAVRGLIRASRDFSESQERWVAAAAKRRPDVGREAIGKLWQQSPGALARQRAAGPQNGGERGEGVEKGWAGVGGPVGSCQEVGGHALRRRSAERTRGTALTSKLGKSLPRMVVHCASAGAFHHAWEGPLLACPDHLIAWRPSWTRREHQSGSGKSLRQSRLIPAVAKS